MDNLQATTYLCTAICSSFYPDNRAIEIALFNAEIDATEEATPKDKSIFMVAVRLVRGYIESSRSEGGVAVSVDRNAIEDAILSWGKEYGLEKEDLVEEVKVVDDGTFLW